MPIPTTFSAPGDETFPALNGFIPSPEDSARFAVWLMFMADDTLRRSLSYVPDNPAAGVRISQGRPDYDPQTLAINLPCVLVAVAVQSAQFRFATSRSGELDVVIGAAYIEAANSSTIRADVETPSLTAETRLHRMRQILMRGTLSQAGMTTNKGRVIDPYLTPLNPDGTYDTAQVKWLTAGPPEITPTRKITFPNKRVRTEKDLDLLDPVRDFAVSYGWLAKYIVDISDRDLMR